ncbi:multidrug effflux MFS transporter [Gryllotalpicola reticulitermitis]|uniref:Multidrug effflux MFS transporter n=1 Tax=Gryllotalpicola reticulitermitis TaxID=1184153 RepID=A0ABV8Q8N8_9MICO
MSDQRAEPGLGVGLLVVLSVLAAAAPLSIDFYLPSFPQVLRSLHTDAASVQLTITAFLVGAGLGQVAWGPISDRFGRRRPLLIGSSIAVLAAAAAVFAPNVQILIGARFVQALAGAAGMVVSRAIVTDRTSGFVAAHSLALLQTIVTVAPIIAPVVGGLVAGHLSWRGVLGVVLAVTVIQALGAFTAVRESLPPERRTPRLRYAHIGQLLGRPGFLGYAATIAFTFGLLMAYISSSSFVYQRVIGMPSWAYGLAFGANALGMMLGGATSVRLARRHVHPARVVRVALVIAVLGAALVLAVVLSPLPTWLIVFPLWFAVTSVGFIQGNTTALAMEQSRGIAGAGSAVIGGLMFLLGGAISPLGGVAGDATALPFAIVMVSSGVCALGAFASARAFVRRHPDAERGFARTAA